MIKKLFLLVVVVSLFSCKDEISDEKSFNAYVNEWIYANMDGIYYWNKDLPAYKKNYNDPEAYFETLLHSEDRFSAIFDDYEALMNRLTGVSPAEVGFDYKLYRESSSNENVLCMVTYTKPSTDASTQGVKRGDMIHRINNTLLTMSNYQQLLEAFTDQTATLKLGFAEYSGGSLVHTGSKTLTKATNYIENPIYLDTVYTVGNKKIAYLVYNFFTGDPGDESLSYDLELNTIMGHFEAQGASELIVDLRYNSGGMMSSAIHLGSMLVPGLQNGKIFSYTEYNKNLTDYFNSAEYKKQYSGNPFEEYFTTTIATGKSQVPVHSLGSRLQRIFFLTGNSTASASEMVINGLKPYLPCVLIGDVTYGKNVGSVVVNDEENPKNKYAFMPIVLKYFNKDRKSDFSTGFVPDYETDDDFDHLLGDTDETLLATAIAKINGSQAPAKSPSWSVSPKAVEELPAHAVRGLIIKAPHK